VAHVRLIRIEPCPRPGALRTIGKVLKCRARSVLELLLWPYRRSSKGFYTRDPDGFFLEVIERD
jgi:hypothetical protein